MTNEEFFNANIKIAYKIANKYIINYGYIIEDIKQTALLGLWKAVLSFNPDNNIAFITYAYKVIYNEINTFLRKEKHIKHQKYLEDVIKLDSRR